MTSPLSDQRAAPTWTARCLYPHIDCGRLAPCSHESTHDTTRDCVLCGLDPHACIYAESERDELLYRAAYALGYQRAISRMLRWVPQYDPALSAVRETLGRLSVWISSGTGTQPPAV